LHGRVEEGDRNHICERSNGGMNTVSIIFKCIACYVCLQVRRCRSTATAVTPGINTDGPDLRLQLTVKTATVETMADLHEGLEVDPLEGHQLSLLEVKCNECCVTVLVWFVMFGFNLTLFCFYLGVLRQPKRPQLSSYK